MFNLRRFKIFYSSFNSYKNYYQILGVSSSAQSPQIKQAYKQLAKKYHPDINKGKEQKFKQINQAYQVLSDPKARIEYDSSRINEFTSQPRRDYQNMNHQYQKTYKRSNKEQNLHPDQRELLEMLRRHQEQFLRQYQQYQQQRGFQRSRFYQEEKEDEQIRKYYQDLQEREKKRRQRNHEYYNQHFDRSKDSLFGTIGDGVKGLWQMWKQLKNKK